MAVGLTKSIGELLRVDDATLIDWDGAAAAATASTPRGRLELDDPTERAYREAVIEARDGIQATVDAEVPLPTQIEVIDRHHWIEQAATSFDRMVTPSMPQLEYGRASQMLNTSTASFTLGYLGRRVIGQYDPALFGDDADATLYIVHPNVEEVATELEVETALFRRWIMHHEVSHVAEFTLAPWLKPLLEDRIRTLLGGLSERRIDRGAMGDLTRAMTAVEGFAELVMDEALDADITALRDRLETRRAGMGPIQQLIERLLGITAKRQQYARGRTFFLDIVEARDLEATLAVWESPENLPTDAELETPTMWLDRVDP